ncbi:Paternally-expressed protein [Toxocara canis]|uniref:Paternally-expressed protein n=1 Tax=Toxocara canis TaxID=6265 RepID=A0A0B2VQM7_TOXCA|nr:Paternally-expressed protein [Toxocara canis]
MEVHHDDQTASEQLLENERNQSAATSYVDSGVAAELNNAAKEVTNFAKSAEFTKAKLKQHSLSSVEDQVIAATNTLFMSDNNAYFEEQERTLSQAFDQTTNCMHDISLESTGNPHEESVVVLTDAFEAADAALRAMEDVIEKAKNFSEQNSHFEADVNNQNQRESIESFPEKDCDRYDVDNAESLEAVLGTDQIPPETISRPAQEEFEEKNKRTGRTYPMPTQNILDEIVYFQETGIVDSGEQPELPKVDENRSASAELDELTFRPQECNSDVEAETNDHKGRLETAPATEHKVSTISKQEANNLEGSLRNLEKSTALSTTVDSGGMEESHALVERITTTTNEINVDAQNAESFIQTAQASASIMKTPDEILEGNEDELNKDTSDRKDERANVVSENGLENALASQPTLHDSIIEKEGDQPSRDNTESENLDSVIPKMTSQVDTNTLYDDQVLSDDLKQLSEGTAERKHLVMKISHVNVEDRSRSGTVDSDYIEEQSREQAGLVEQDQGHISRDQPPVDRDTNMGKQPTETKAFQQDQGPAKNSQETVDGSTTADEQPQQIAVKNRDQHRGSHAQHAADTTMGGETKEMGVTEQNHDGASYYHEPVNSTVGKGPRETGMISDDEDSGSHAQQLPDTTMADEPREAGITKQEHGRSSYDHEPVDTAVGKHPRGMGIIQRDQENGSYAQQLVDTAVGEQPREIGVTDQDQDRGSHDHEPVDTAVGGQPCEMGIIEHEQESGTYAQQLADTTIGEQPQEMGVNDQDHEPVDIAVGQQPQQMGIIEHGRQGTYDQQLADTTMREQLQEMGVTDQDHEPIDTAVGRQPQEMGIIEHDREGGTYAQQLADRTMEALPREVGLTDQDQNRGSYDQEPVDMAVGGQSWKTGVIEHDEHHGSHAQQVAETTMREKPKEMGVTEQDDDGASYNHELVDSVVGEQPRETGVTEHDQNSGSCTQQLLDTTMGEELWETGLVEQDNERGRYSQEPVDRTVEEQPREVGVFGQGQDNGSYAQQLAATTVKEQLQEMRVTDQNQDRGSHDHEPVDIAAGQQPQQMEIIEHGREGGTYDQQLADTTTREQPQEMGANDQDHEPADMAVRGQPQEMGIIEHDREDGSNAQQLADTTVREQLQEMGITDQNQDRGSYDQEPVDTSVTEQSWETGVIEHDEHRGGNAQQIAETTMREQPQEMGVIEHDVDGASYNHELVDSVVGEQPRETGVTEHDQNSGSCTQQLPNTTMGEDLRETRLVEQDNERARHNEEPVDRTVEEQPREVGVFGQGQDHGSYAQHLEDTTTEAQLREVGVTDQDQDHGSYDHKSVDTALGEQPRGMGIIELDQERGSYDQQLADTTIGEQPREMGVTDENQDRGSHDHEPVDTAVGGQPCEMGIIEHEQESGTYAQQLADTTTGEQPRKVELTDQDQNHGSYGQEPIDMAMGGQSWETGVIEHDEHRGSHGQQVAETTMREQPQEIGIIEQDHDGASQNHGPVDSALGEQPRETEITEHDQNNDSCTQQLPDMTMGEELRETGLIEQDHERARHDEEPVDRTVEEQPREVGVFGQGHDNGSCAQDLVDMSTGEQHLEMVVAKQDQDHASCYHEPLDTTVVEHAQESEVFEEDYHRGCYAQQPIDTAMGEQSQETLIAEEDQDRAGYDQEPVDAPVVGQPPEVGNIEQDRHRASYTQQPVDSTVREQSRERGVVEQDELLNSYTEQLMDNILGEQPREVEVTQEGQYRAGYIPQPADMAVGKQRRENGEINQDEDFASHNQELVKEGRTEVAQGTVKAVPSLNGENGTSHDAKNWLDAMSSNDKKTDESLKSEIKVLASHEDTASQKPVAPDNPFSESETSEGKSDEQRALLDQSLENADASGDKNFEALFESYMANHEIVKMMVADLKERPRHEEGFATSEVVHRITQRPHAHKSVGEWHMLEKAAKMEHMEPEHCYMEEQGGFTGQDAAYSESIVPGDQQQLRQLASESVSSGWKGTESDQLLGSQRASGKQGEVPPDSDFNIAQKEQDALFGQDASYVPDGGNQAIQGEIVCAADSLGHDKHGVVTQEANNITQTSETVDERSNGHLEDNVVEETAKQLKHSEATFEQPITHEQLGEQKEAGDKETKWQNIVPEDGIIPHIQQLNALTVQPETATEPQETEKHTSLEEHMEPDHLEEGEESLSMRYVSHNYGEANTNIVLQEENIFATDEHDMPFEDSLVEPPIEQNEKAEETNEEKQLTEQFADKIDEFPSSMDTILISSQMKLMERQPSPPPAQPEFGRNREGRRVRIAENNDLPKVSGGNYEVIPHSVDAGVITKAGATGAAKSILAKSAPGSRHVPTRREKTDILKDGQAEIKQPHLDARRQQKVTDATNTTSGKHGGKEPGVVKKPQPKTISNKIADMKPLPRQPVVGHGAVGGGKAADIKRVTKAPVDRSSDQQTSQKAETPLPRTPSARVTTSKVRPNAAGSSKKPPPVPVKTSGKPQIDASLTKLVEKTNVVGKRTEVKLVRKNETKLSPEPQMRNLDMKSEEVGESISEENTKSTPTTKTPVKPALREPIVWLETLVPVFEAIWVSCKPPDDSAIHTVSKPIEGIEPAVETKNYEGEFKQEEKSEENVQEPSDKLRSDNTEPILHMGPLASKSVDTSEEPSSSQCIIIPALESKHKLPEASEAVAEEHSQFPHSEAIEQTEQHTSVNEALSLLDTPSQKEHYSDLASAQKDSIGPSLQSIDFLEDNAAIKSSACALNASSTQQQLEENPVAGAMLSGEFADVAELHQNSLKQEVDDSGVIDVHSSKEAIPSPDHSKEEVVPEITSGAENVELNAAKLDQITISTPAVATEFDHTQKEPEAKADDDQASDQKPSRPRQHGRGQFRGSMMCEQEDWRQSNGRQENKQKQSRAQQADDGEHYGQQHSSQHKSKRRSRKSGKGQRGSQT